MLKNRTTRVATLLLALTLITCCFVGSTFAKYTSTASGNSATKIAQWDIQMLDENGTTQNIGVATNNTIKFSLFDTILDTDTGATDEEVKTNYIAPGTKGEFSFTVKNNSEVDAEFKVDFDIAENAPTNLKFAVKLDESAAYSYGDNIAVDTTSIEMGETITVYVAWEWAFVTDAAGNVADTLDGVEAITEEDFDVTATITVEQVD